MSEARVKLTAMMEAVDYQIKIDKYGPSHKFLVSVYDSLENIANTWDDESAREFAGDDLTPSYPDEPLAEWEKELLYGI